MFLLSFQVHLVPDEHVFPSRVSICLHVNRHLDFGYNTTHTGIWPSLLRSSRIFINCRPCPTLKQTYSSHHLAVTPTSHLAAPLFIESPHLLIVLSHFTQWVLCYLSLAFTPTIFNLYDPNQWLFLRYFRCYPPPFTT